ncbi:MAG TPA: response regulator [Pyrinomonadaceae bacterium]|jgi:CheY-like chemotaxis protein
MQSALAPAYPQRLENIYPVTLASQLFSSGRDRSTDQAAHNADCLGVNEDKPLALVVDDAPDVTEMLALFLQHAGYETVMAFSAQEALEAVRDGRFDVIVSDIGMPGMSGYELAEAVRALDGYAEVPMIAVTGFSAFDDRGRALKSGFNAHLTKPVNPASLLELIQRLRD